MAENLSDSFKTIKAFVFDIDGVLTNGHVLITEEGHMLRSMNIKDGYALQHAIKQGYNIGIISGGKGSGILARLQGLGITDVYLGQSHKMEAFEELLAKWNIGAREIAYMGDDYPDLPVLKKVGLPCSPADACQEVLEIAHYISTSNGGMGCVRELIEKVMKLQNTWNNSDSTTW